jgi:GNAT superfamily N-acetyltransferase
VDLLERFDEQVRRSGTDEQGMFVGEGWSAVLALPPDVNAAVERLRSLPGEREWKLFGHDPAWLPHRLRELGLEPGDEETVMVAECAALPAAEGDLRPVDSPELVHTFDEIAIRAFGHGSEGVKRDLLQSLKMDEPLTIGVIAFVAGDPVSCGRIELTRFSEFAGLFGGATVPEHRGRGHYRATVAKRAELARELGYRWIYVDALPTSQPILERLGFVGLTTTTPWIFAPDPAARSSG